MTDADQLLAYIEQRGHVSYDELKRVVGDDLYQILNALQLSGKVQQTWNGVVSERQRQQSVLDKWWQQRRDWEEYERRRDESSSFHRGPGDPDWT